MASAREVNDFHTNDDVDGSWNAHHHTLGYKANQAAGGNHIHTFVKLAQPATLTGERGVRLFFGSGAPGALEDIVGAATGDRYVDADTGTFYTL